MKEISFFENSNVIVTGSRFIVASKVYEIKDIISVKIEVVKGKSIYKFILMMAGFLLIFFNDFRIIGSVIFFAGFLSLYFAEEKFAVHMETASKGEVNGLVSKDKLYIEQVIKAINHAIEAHYLKTVPM